jgi:hypothetical protein
MDDIETRTDHRRRGKKSQGEKGEPLFGGIDRRKKE